MKCGTSYILDPRSDLTTLRMVLGWVPGDSVDKSVVISCNSRPQHGKRHGSSNNVQTQIGRHYIGQCLSPAM